MKRKAIRTSVSFDPPDLLGDIDKLVDSILAVADDEVMISRSSVICTILELSFRVFPTAVDWGRVGELTPEEKLLIHQLYQ